MFAFDTHRAVHGNHEDDVAKLPDDVGTHLDSCGIQTVSTKKDVSTVPRLLEDQFKALTNKLKKENYPQFSRFCMVDLRYIEKEQKGDDAKDDTAKDSMFMFEAAKDSGTLHKSAMSLNYFHNTKMSIIPSDQKQADDDGTEPKPILDAASKGPHITVCIFLLFAV